MPLCENPPHDHIYAPLLSPAPFHMLPRTSRAPTFTRMRCTNTVHVHHSIYSFLYSHHSLCPTSALFHALDNQTGTQKCKDAGAWVHGTTGTTLPPPVFFSFPHHSPIRKHCLMPSDVAWMQEDRAPCHCDRATTTPSADPPRAPPYCRCMLIFCLFPSFFFTLCIPSGIRMQCER